MTINRSTRYALYAAAEMATAGEAPVTVTEVARRYGIPGGALAKVFQQLVRAGVAIGTRGIGGGYRLARPASRITVLDVMRVFERPRTPGTCVLHDRPGQQCPEASACNLHWLFEEVDELVRCTYESVTLETLVRRSRARQGAVLASALTVVRP
ncbi:MAG TPA: Rrf2 family transcriptional regulator [Vicinamibacterales bacterium]|nr:Rrf2 family transcriptional regulator [Vicinamibacterales bacterium]